MAYQNLPSCTVEGKRKNTSFFIELLQQHPSTWNVKSKEYKIKNIRSASVKDIIIELSGYMNCTIKTEDVMKTMHTLKSHTSSDTVLISLSNIVHLCRTF